MKIEFLDLGMQPIANAFIKDKIKKEYMYHLKMQFDTKNYLVSQVNKVEPSMMFNDGYVYHSSNSKTMRKHFKDTSQIIKNEFNTNSVLEIGSNDGVFIKNFSNENAIAVEPCENFAKVTNDLGYQTYDKFWNADLSNEIVKNHGKQNIIYSANCMCHIPDILGAFKSIKNTLVDDGVFIFEDPSLVNMIKRCSYDQLYDEHVHIFSIIALQNIFREIGMTIFKVDNTKVHGGSNRIYVKNISNSNITTCPSVEKNIKLEMNENLHKISTYKNFAKEVKKSKEELLRKLKLYKSQNKKIISYGATSKSTTVFNYCNIDSNIIDYIVDTTPSKQNKFSPGVNIPVIPYENNFNNNIDIAFLGAWNYFEEITKKEKQFLDRGGVFITHIKGLR